MLINWFKDKRKWPFLMHNFGLQNTIFFNHLWHIMQIHLCLFRLILISTGPQSSSHAKTLKLGTLLKKFSFNFSIFHKGGGGVSEPIPKFWGTFLCPDNFGILGRKGGRVDQIQKFWGTFFLNCWWNMTKKCPKSFF